MPSNEGKLSFWRGTKFSDCQVAPLPPAKQPPSPPYFGRTNPQLFPIFCGSFFDKREAVDSVISVLFPAAKLLMFHLAFQCLQVWTNSLHARFSGMDFSAHNPLLQVNGATPSASPLSPRFANRRPFGRCYNCQRSLCWMRYLEKSN